MRAECSPESHRFVSGDAVGIGNKARGLRLCAEVGIRVPPWFAIAAETARLQPWRHDQDFEKALLEQARCLAGDEGSALMVRSSTALEDSVESSHAGEFRSERVDGLSDLAAGIERVSEYKAKASLEKFWAGVVVQKYVAGIVSGVAFSSRPSGGTKDKFYCEFVDGGCEQLVRGDVTPRRASIDVRLGTVECLGSEGMAGMTPGMAGMTPELGRELGEWLHRLEAATGKPYDMEWVHDGTMLWCVQARPISRLSMDQQYLPAFCATSWFYDERFRVPVTPLTRSTLMPLIFKAALEDPVQMAGGKASAEDVFYYGGRPYVPHRFYRQMFEGVPRWLLTPSLRPLFPGRCRCTRGRVRGVGAAVSWGRRLWKVVESVPEWLGNRRAWRRFKRELQVELARLKRLPAPESAAWLEHWKLLDRWTERFLAIHRWSILLADCSNAVLELWLRLLQKKRAAALRRDFAAGLALPTREANRALVAVARGGAMTKEEFVERFGHRSESLDYAQPRWAERFAGDRIVEDFPLLSEVDGEEAGAQGGRLRWPLLSELMEMREQQRFEWERILALQRRMVVEMGARLCREKMVERPEDVWLLQWGELLGAMAGTLALDQRELEYRKHVHVVETTMRAPQFIPWADRAEAVSAGAVLKGLGASAGMARGPVIVIGDNDELYAQARKGSVLVMRSMSPADTPVLLGVRGVVLERGGLLSHAAIMAREYGIPLVTSVADATEVLRTGMVAIVDGDTGTVEFAWRSHDEQE